MAVHDPPPTAIAPHPEIASTGSQSAPNRGVDAPRWTRAVQLACAALFIGTTFCSLWLSASSTLHKAELVHVPTGAVWSAVGVLELVSLAGTMRWLIARNRRGRIHAIAVVAAVAVVTGFAGWAAYGWFGLVAPIAVVATIHMVHETLDDLTATAQQWGGPSQVDVPPAQPATLHALDAPTPAVDPVPEVLDPVTEPVRLHAVDAPMDAGVDDIRTPGARRTWRQARPLAQELGVTRRADWSVGDLNAAIDERLREQEAAS